MLKTKLSLDVLAKELKELPKERQFKIKGGYFGSPIVLPPVSIVDTPLDDDTPDPGDNPYNEDPSDSMGGSVGSSFEDSDDDISINDPEGVVENFKDWLRQTKEGVENIIESGRFPTGLDAEDFQNYLEKLEKVSDIIEMMETSTTQEYRIDVGPTEDGSDATTTMDPDTGEIVITIIPEVLGDNGLFAHELWHIEQIANGDVAFDENGHLVGVSLEDEVEAFQFQHEIAKGARHEFYDLAGNRVPEGGYEVTAWDVLELDSKYSNLPISDNEGDPATSASCR